jgi:hypothetical protein
MAAFYFSKDFAGRIISSGKCPSLKRCSRGITARLNPSPFPRISSRRSKSDQFNEPFLPDFNILRIPLVCKSGRLLFPGEGVKRGADWPGYA